VTRLMAPIPIRYSALAISVLVSTGMIACSNSSSVPVGPAHDGGTELDGDIPILPGCNEPADAARVGPAYTYTALLVGACTGSASCRLSIDPCCRPTGNDLVDGYTCSCQAGGWTCVVTSPGGGGCPYGLASSTNCIADAGSD